MKRYILIAFYCLITFTNCSISNNNNDDIPNQVIKTYWHLTNVSGGFAGVNHDFELGDIIWFFDEVTAELSVENLNTNNSLEDGLDTGNYIFSVQEVNNETFLIIDSNEFGNFTFSQTELVINQNITTSGSGADGFIYVFERVLVTEN